MSRTVKSCASTTSGYEFYLKTPFGHIVSLDGDKMKVRNNFELRKGGQGYGMSTENVGYTLSCRDRHLVAIMKGC